VVNIPALGAFVLIFGLYSFLVSRTNAINQAAEERKEALQAVRQTKSDQIAGKDVGGEKVVDSIEVEQALAAYKKAILNEESLRTLAPGIRIRAPNGIWSEDDKIAAKQLVGIDFQQDEKLEPQLQMLFDAEKRDGKRGFSNMSVAVMGLVVTLLLGLQVFMLTLQSEASSSLTET